MKTANIFFMFPSSSECSAIRKQAAARKPHSARGLPQGSGQASGVLISRIKPARMIARFTFRKKILGGNMKTVLSAALTVALGALSAPATAADPVKDYP